MNFINPQTKEILISNPLPSKILNFIRSKNEQGESIEGKDLITFFEAPPYGWDNRIIRLVVAALIKNGSLFLEIGGREYFDPIDAELKNALKGIQVSTRHASTLAKILRPVNGMNYPGIFQRSLALMQEIQ